MKKIIPILIGAVVILGCIFIAGCVENPAGIPTTGGGTPGEQTVEPSPGTAGEIKEPAYTVTVTTAGNDAYSTGDIFSLEFVSNPSTGYSWKLIEGNDILYKELNKAALHTEDIDIALKSEKTTDSLGTVSEEGAVAIVGGKDVKESDLTEGTESGNEANIVGANEKQTFWFQPGKAGDYKITLKYMREWEGEESAISTYSQTIHVVDSNEPSVNGAKTQYSFDSFYINPAAGEFVKIVKTANPTTGYYWTASGEGLTIEDNYVVDNEELVGSPGKYEWYAKADKAGDYIFKAVLKHAGSDEVLSYFEIPLKFV